MLPLLQAQPPLLIFSVLKREPPFLPPRANEPGLPLEQHAQQQFQLQFLIFSALLQPQLAQQQNQPRLEFFWVPHPWLRAGLLVLPQELPFSQRQLFQLCALRFLLEFLLCAWRLLELRDLLRFLPRGVLASKRQSSLPLALPNLPQPLISWEQSLSHSSPPWAPAPAWPFALLQFLWPILPALWIAWELHPYLPFQHRHQLPIWTFSGQVQLQPWMRQVLPRPLICEERFMFQGQQGIYILRKIRDVWRGVHAKLNKINQ